MVLAAAAFPSSLQAQAGAPAARFERGGVEVSPSSSPVLDVPYLPQSEALCGGAAIAMIMRYWGARGVYAETFADLVDVDAGGIRGHELIRALEGRGFDVSSFEGDAARIRSSLAARRPPVVLIEDRPGRFHYVVIVGWLGTHVIVHDPARAPFRVIAADAFGRAWAASRFWTLIAQPSTDATTAAAIPAPENPSGNRMEASRTAVTAGASPLHRVCAGMVEEGIRLAGAGDLAAAQGILELAAVECAADPAPWRELAGVHALRSEWSDAARDARRALDRDPHDHHAARILATSLFLEGDDAGALDAWNRIDAPAIDIVDIRGLERTRFAVAAAALDLPPEALLTGRRLARARRRLDALPSLMGSRVSYEPGEDDRAQVNAAVLERPLVPSGLIPLAATGLRAATDRELGVAIASPTGSGERVSASWRWWERRPRLAVEVAAPSPFGGIWSVEAFVERQTYGRPPMETLERRRGMVLKASDWINGAVRVEAGGAVDRWDDGVTASLLGGVDRLFAGGRGSASLAGAVMTGTHRARTASASAEWRSTQDRAGDVWQARAGFALAGRAAPLALWAGAGTGQGRDLLLRAHPLLDDGVIRGVFGRRLTFAGGEWRHWLRPVFRTVQLAPAIFVDTARASRVPAFGDRRAHVDAGGGIRVAVPGTGVLRVDVARGLRDGETAFSFGWTR